MKQPKKLFTRILINNWGGISHKILVLHEDCDLFRRQERLGKIHGHGRDPGRSIWKCVR